ncbi:hypothetical protein BSKO_11871 [Bryopsis sp. KO-2023]|nr:hypothetical protein BSKO_11871 [Bryopsis sp. KO-2023]
MAAAKIAFSCVLLILAIGANGQGLGGLGGGLAGGLGGMGGGAGGRVVSTLTDMHKAKICRKLALIGQDGIALCQEKEVKTAMKEMEEEEMMEEEEKIIYVKEVLPKATGDVVYHPKATAEAMYEPKATAEVMYYPKATAEVVYTPKATEG